MLLAGSSKHVASPLSSEARVPSVHTGGLLQGSALPALCRPSTAPQSHRVPQESWPPLWRTPVLPRLSVSLLAPLQPAHASCQCSMSWSPATGWRMETTVPRCLLLTSTGYLDDHMVLLLLPSYSIQNKRHIHRLVPPRPEAGGETAAAQFESVSQLTLWVVPSPATWTAPNHSVSLLPLLPAPRQTPNHDDELLCPSSLPVNPLFRILLPCFSNLFSKQRVSFQLFLKFSKSPGIFFF